MKIHVITYCIEDGQAGISGAYKHKAKATRRFESLVRDTFSGGDTPKKKIEAAVKAALKEGFHEYQGSGQGAQPWYALEEVEVFE